MVGIVESQAISYFADTLAPFGQLFFHALDKKALDMLVGTFSGFPLDKVTEIIGRECQTLSALLHIGEDRARSVPHCRNSRKAYVRNGPEYPFSQPYG